MMMTTRKLQPSLNLVCSNNLSSRRCAILVGRSIHSSYRSFDHPARYPSAPQHQVVGNGSDPIQKENPVNPLSSGPSSSSPASFRSSALPNENFHYHSPPQTGAHHNARHGYLDLANGQQPNHNLPPLPHFTKSQAPNSHQFRFPPNNPYPPSFPNPPQYTGPQDPQRAWDHRIPPHFYQLRAQPVPGFAPQHPLTPPQPREGFHDTNRTPAQRFQPQRYSSPPPPHMSHTSYAPVSSGQPQTGYGMFPHPPFIPQTSMNSSTPFNASDQPPIRRSKKTLDFDFQDLDGANALHPFEEANNGLSKTITGNPPAFSQHAAYPTAGNRSDQSNFARGAPSSQSWNNYHSAGATNYPRFAPRSNFNSRNLDGNKSHPGARTQPHRNGNNRRTTGPNQFRRDRGRGLLTRKPEPELPPPPKTVLNEDGEYGMKPTPSGVPGTISDSQSPKNWTLNDSLSDYQSIPRIITDSTTPINLPGFPKPIQFETSKLIQASDSNEITWTHGDANKDKVLNRALNLAIQNPSLNIIQKKQTVALVDFLLLSKVERLSRIKS